MYCPTSKGCQKCRALEAAKILEMPNGTKRRRCDSCGRGIPPYTAMQGAGFQSETVDHHWVDTNDQGMNFHIPVTLELCHDCYVADYAKVFPNAPSPQIVNVADWEDVPQRFDPSPRTPANIATGCFVFTA